jgi:hypothetical protein
LAARPAEGAALILYLVWVLGVGWRHEPWFDEAQAWLIARDNSLVSLLVSGVRYEGAPALWHLVLFAAQRLGFPYGGLWLISSALCAGGAALILYRAPFPLWLRLGLTFSYFIAYQYAAVARSYALDVLFTPLLALLYPDRATRPLAYGGVLGLIAATNAHSFVFAAAVALEWAFALKGRLLALKPRAWAGVMLYAVLGLLATVEAWPPKDINFLNPKPDDNPLLHALILVSEAVIDRVDLWSLTPPPLWSRWAGAGATLAILAPAAWLWLRARTLPLAGLIFAGLLGFSALKYGNLWHAGIVFLALMFCLWISWGSVGRLGTGARRGLMGALAVLVLVQAGYAVAAGARGVLTLYSPAQPVAEALRRTPNARIGAAGFKAFAVQPYFTRNIFANYEGGRARPAYYLWRRGEDPIPGLGEAEWRRTAAAGYDRLLLSTFNVMGWNGPARYILDAWRAGYCPSAVYSGEMIWKTYVMESDDMMLFDRCHAPRVSPAPPESVNPIRLFIPASGRDAARRRPPHDV